MEVEKGRIEKEKVEKGQDKKEKAERQEKMDQRIEETGQLTLDENRAHKNIHLLTIIGEVEGA